MTTIDIILHCPLCHTQHVDAATAEWDNPPHRSHLCGTCGHIWRPADVPTNGVQAITTRGKDDSQSSTRTAHAKIKTWQERAQESGGGWGNHIVYAQAEIADLRAALTIPDRMTPKMLQTVQMYSELGAYAASNLAGAYHLFDEFWKVAVKAIDK